MEEMCICISEPVVLGVYSKAISRQGASILKVQEVLSMGSLYVLRADSSGDGQQEGSTGLQDVLGGPSCQVRPDKDRRELLEVRIPERGAVVMILMAKAALQGNVFEYHGVESLLLKGGFYNFGLYLL